MRELLVPAALIAGLVLGYLAGSRTSAPVYPSNYDSARAICTDALKAEHDDSNGCWKQVIALLADRKNCNTCGKIYQGIKRIFKAKS